MSTMYNGGFKVNFDDKTKELISEQKKLQTKI